MVIIITDCIIIVLSLCNKLIKYKLLLKFGQLIPNVKSIFKKKNVYNLIYNFIKMFIHAIYTINVCIICS